MKLFAKTSRLTRLLLVLLLFALVARGQTPAPSPMPPATDEVSAEQKRQDTFELVWETINKHFYDPNFNGLDWKAVHDRYAPQVARVRSDAELYSLLQLMLNELRQSHLWIIPPEAIPKLRTKKTADKPDLAIDEMEEPSEEDPEEETALDLIKEELADKLSTGIGVDVRVLNRAIVITRVTPGSPAARAGLRPGFTIKSVNGRTAVAALAELETNRVFRDIIRPIIPTLLVAGFINGEGSDTLDITYLDGRNVIRRVRLKPEKLSGEMSEGIGNLPPLYAEFESRRLAGGIGYIRFNAFVPAMMKKTCAALREMRDAPGIVIDLRGNEGGLLGMVSGLGGLLQGYSSVFGKMKTRSGENSVVVWPQRQPYTRPLAILVDGSTLSAAEMFAAAMQASGRAIVIGEVSAGSTLPSTIIKLPTGALFQYAFGNYETSDGVQLEGRGVVPDTIVKLNRLSLLRSGDPQLAQALVKLRERISWEPKELIAEITTVAPPAKPRSPTVVTVDPPPPPKPSSSPTPSVVITMTVDPPPPPKPSSSPTPSGVITMKANPPPPQPKPSSSPGVTTKDAENARLAKQIINRYIETIGGEAALKKITTRVSTGTVELPMDLTGTVEVHEAAPNRSSVIMNLKGFGTLQTTFDRSGSWVHDPVRGYLQLSAVTTTEDTFHRELLLLKEANSIRFERKDKVGDEDCFVLVHSIGSYVIQRLYFSVSTGLLLRQNNMYLEDYREVDGIKLPFVSRSENATGRLSTVVRLKEVKHNVAIDESKFAERADCFTRPDQKWSAQNK